MQHLRNACARGARGRSMMLATSITLACAAPAVAQRIPASSTLSVRTLDSVSGDPGRRGRAVRVMVIAPLYAGSRMLVAPRTMIEGTVVDAGTQASGGGRHFVQLAFTSVVLGDGTRIAITARVATVDDSRDSVDAAGRVLGPKKPSVLRDKRDWAALALGTLNPVAGLVFFAAMRGEQEERYRRIDFPPGTDLTLLIVGEAALPAWPVFPAPEAAGSDSTLHTLLARVPMRTEAAGGRAPGDFVNVLFIGPDEDVRAAFRAAGWDEPARGSTRSDFETFVKAAEGEGYAHQPVSKQLMFGRPPDLVFERVADTFAKRHHIRLWRTGETWLGVPVWVAAATHDIGLEFSLEYRNFTHRTDSAIDGERDKVVSDLVTAEQVRQLSMVPRALAPDRATRGRVTSDWRVAVVRVAGHAPNR